MRRCVTGKCISNSSWNEGASNQAVSDLVGQLDISLPDDYLTFLRKSDGGEGFLGRDYLILWRAEDIVKFNREYEVDEYAPGLLIFGSNGGGEAYAFDTRVNPMQVVQVPFIGMDLADAIPVAESFSSLLFGTSS
ncbi:cell wall assembly protein [Burkholderia ubonensis]|uniref:SMI1/KNR4 family protein n=1 Tax=Burkholderia ubonensis TaxID=101571 RepID=UPI000758940F|nr:cell wall assembly protein [Burkholderia ubonensis]KVR20021.1 cell wall assembly protein [Burkholderia ubonensis]KWD20137.1 cell wall assembly protein [Burkholderia ubonensis]KWD22108.1 cell wall assembly protein [Burkholderia ubonensis]